MDLDMKRKIMITNIGDNLEIRDRCKPNSCTNTGVGRVNVGLVDNTRERVEVSTFLLKHGPMNNTAIAIF
eukprot:2733042-Ditylum_brightwellii.AAC.1